MLRCENLSIAVPGRVLARGIGFEVKAGELWAVLGPNGSGKTTLIHTLAGIVPAGAGTIWLAGRMLATASGPERARAAGVLLQQEEPGYWGTVLEYVLLGRFAQAASIWSWTAEDERCAGAALAAVGLETLGGRRLRTLSGGERQLARIAQLLAQDPLALLLDEPLQHLDLKHQAAMLELARGLTGSRGKGVVMVLHDTLWPGRYCTHAVLMHDSGEVEHGAAREMLVQERLERLYGCPLREIESGGQRFFAPV